MSEEAELWRTAGLRMTDEEKMMKQTEEKRRRLWEEGIKVWEEREANRLPLSFWCLASGLSLLTLSVVATCLVLVFTTTDNIIIQQVPASNKTTSTTTATITSKAKTHSATSLTALVMSSSGRGAREVGCALGQFYLLPSHPRGAAVHPVYQQADTTSSSQFLLFYSQHLQKWLVGNDSLGLLENFSTSLQPPTTGWRVGGGTSRTSAISLQAGQLQPCVRIHLTTQTQLVSQQNNTFTGFYNKLDQWSRGRPVYLQEGSQARLLVPPDFSHWQVQNTSGFTLLHSMMATNAPQSSPLDQWHYWSRDSQDWQNISIHINCSHL